VQFDNAARLVLCNQVYIDMYRLRPEHARPGTPLRDLLMHRLAAGNFHGDPDRYVADVLREAAEGRTEIKTIELKDGRVIALVSRPMRGGGWLATHSDVTEQLAAEKERDSLRQREERRRAVDVAISAFRARVENVLETVSQSATAMKAAAKLLLTTSDHTLQRAEGAVHGSNAASANVETAATAAAELSVSIKEISCQLGQANQVVRAAAADATATNEDIAGLAHVAQKIGDVVKLIQGHRRPDQSLGAQRHDRGGARRRGGTGLCRRGLGGQVARGADRQGYRRNHPRNSFGTNFQRQGGLRNPRNHPADAGHQHLHRGRRRFGSAAGARDRRDFTQ
jgi:uncharacterized protein YoxC